MPDFGNVGPARRLALLPVPGQTPLRPMFRALGIAASGLSAQRQRMEVVAQNIANANTTRGPDGAPYKRQDVVMESATAQTARYGATTPYDAIAGTTSDTSAFGSAPFSVPAMSDAPRTMSVPIAALPTSENGVVAPAAGQYGVRVAGIAEDQGEGHEVYDPAHPDANENGFVRYPNVNTTQEMVQLLDAHRMYEANASVFQTAKSMLRAALDI